MSAAALLALALIRAPAAAAPAPLARLQLGASLWDVGLASDTAFKNASLTFRRDGETRVAPLGDLSRLRTSGVEVEIEPGLVYRFSLAVSWLDPLRRSTLEVRPVDGTAGPSHALNTGELLDALQAAR